MTFEGERRKLTLLQRACAESSFNSINFQRHAKRGKELFSFALEVHERRSGTTYCPIKSIIFLVWTLMWFIGSSTINRSVCVIREESNIFSKNFLIFLLQLHFRTFPIDFFDSHIFFPLTLSHTQLSSQREWNNTKQCKRLRDYITESTERKRK